MEVVRFAAGATIFEEGQHGRRAFIVRSGLIEISKSTAAGNAVIGYVGAGKIFGEMSPIDRLPRMSGAKAVRDTDCIVISRDQFARKLSRSDPFIRDLLHMLLRSMRDLTDDFVKLNDRSNEEITAA
jgi:CRP-like cAMP-binding protein